MPRPFTSMKIFRSTLLQLLDQDFSARSGLIEFDKLATGREPLLGAVLAARCEDIPSLSRPRASPASHPWDRPIAPRTTLGGARPRLSWPLIPAQGYRSNPIAAAPTAPFLTDLSLQAIIARPHLPLSQRPRAAHDGAPAFLRHLHTLDLRACIPWVRGLLAAGLAFHRAPLPSSLVRLRCRAAGRGRCLSIAPTPAPSRLRMQTWFLRQPCRHLGFRAVETRWRAAPAATTHGDGEPGIPIAVASAALPS